MSVYITSIKIQNIQSWESGIIPLGKGFNVIRSADNSAGKSVIMKCIKVTMCPGIFSRDERKGLIREGKEYGEITFMFSDGTAGVTRVFPTKTLHYYYNGEVWTGNSDSPMPEVVDKLGGIVDYNINFIANLLDLDQPLLLLKSDNKLNHSLIELITHHQVGDIIPIIKDKLIELKESNAEMTLLTKVQANQLNTLQFTDVDKLERDIDVSEAMLEVLGDLVNVSSLMDTNIDSMQGKKDISYALDIIEVAESLSPILNFDFTVPKAPSRDVLDIINIVECLDGCVNTLNSIPKQPDVDMLYLTEGLIGVAEAVNTLHEETVSSFAEIRKTLVSLHNIIRVSEDELRYSHKLKQEADELELRLKTEGASAMCPVYGNILVKDGKCSVVEGLR